MRDGVNVILSGDRPGEFRTSEPFAVAVVLAKSLTVPQTWAQTVAVEVANGAGVAGPVRCGDADALAAVSGDRLEDDAGAAVRQPAKTVMRTSATRARTTR